MYIYLLLLLIGIISGILTSLFGLGGGITVVPTLMYILPYMGVDPSISLYVAIGTSLAIMLISNANASRIHYNHGNLNLVIAAKIIPYIIIGSILGVLLSSKLPGKYILLFFILFVLISFIRTTANYDSNQKLAKNIIQPISNLVAICYGLITGITSSFLGVGSSLIMVPFLQSRGLLIKQAAALSASFNVITAFAASISYYIISYNLNKSSQLVTGFIFWPAFIIILIGTTCGVPMGVKIASKCSDKTLRYIYSGFILLILVSMINKLIVSLR